MAKHKSAGIYKGVSEPVYSADILAESALMGTTPDVKGAWMWALLLMWRNRTHEVTDSIEGWSRIWGCDVTQTNAIVTVIEARKIGIVSRDCHGNVTLGCRRLARRTKSKEGARLRKSAQRERQECHATVTGEKSLPSSSSSFSSSSSSLDMGESKAAVASAPPTAVPPSPPTDHMAVTLLVKQFVTPAKWVGDRSPVYRAITGLLEHYASDTISAAIASHAHAGAKPWDIQRWIEGAAPPDGPKSFQELDREREKARWLA